METTSNNKSIPATDTIRGDRRGVLHEEEEKEKEETEKNFEETCCMKKKFLIVFPNPKKVIASHN